MRPRTAYLFFCIVGCLIVLAGLVYVLYRQQPLTSLAFYIMGGIGGYLLLVNLWAYWLSDDSPGIAVGATTHATVLGFVIILSTVTLRLMQYPLDPALLKLIPTLGLILLVLGLLLSGRAPTTPRQQDESAAPTDPAALALAATKTMPQKTPRADRYGLAPISAYTLLSVTGFLVILYAIAHSLQFADHDRKLITALVGLGLFIMLLALWLYRQTGIIQVIRPYRYLGLGTVVCVVGLLLIFAMLSLQLMYFPIATRQGHAAFGGGLLLIGLGLGLTRSDQQIIRLVDR